MTKPATFWNETTSQAAIYGTDYSSSKPVKLTVNASGGSLSTSTATLVVGAYTFLSTCNAYCVMGEALVAPDGTQGTGTTGSFVLPAGTPVTISVQTASKVSVISIDTNTGVFIATGPILRGDYD